VENKKPPPDASGGFLENLELCQIFIPQLALPVIWTRQPTETERRLVTVALIAVEMKWIILVVTTFPITHPAGVGKEFLNYTERTPRGESPKPPRTKAQSVWSQPEKVPTGFTAWPART